MTINDGEIHKRLLRIAKDRNIIVIENESITSLKGFYLQSMNDIKIIFLNMKLIRDVSELNFILAHELGHVELHTLHTQKGNQSEIEKEADEYAINLIREIGKDSLIF